MRVLTLVGCVLGLALGAASVQAAPWDGGDAVVTPLEATISAAASQELGRPVSLFCEDESAWATLGHPGALAFAYTGGNRAYFSPQLCFWAQAFWEAGDKESLRTCQIGVTVESVAKTEKTRVRVCKRVKVQGHWRKRCHWETRKYTYTGAVVVPEMGTCPGWYQTVGAIETLAHEAIHLAGERDEAKTECYAMQRAPWWAEQLGASPEQGREVASDFWTLVYPARSATYQSPDCRENGPLDLTPGDGIWP